MRVERTTITSEISWLWAAPIIGIIGALFLFTQRMALAGGVLSMVSTAILLFVVCARKPLWVKKSRKTSVLEDNDNEQTDNTQ